MYGKDKPRFGVQGEETEWTPIISPSLSSSTTNRANGSLFTSVAVTSTAAYFVSQVPLVSISLIPSFISLSASLCPPFFIIFNLTGCSLSCPDVIESEQLPAVHGSLSLCLSPCLSLSVSSLSVSSLSVSHAYINRRLFHLRMRILTLSSLFRCREV